MNEKVKSVSGNDTVRLMFCLLATSSVQVNEVEGTSELPRDSLASHVK